MGIKESISEEHFQKNQKSSEKSEYKGSGSIAGIRLQYYKAFQDTGWIDFNKFTLLYGYNSNGKSTILRFLYQLKLCIGAYRIGRDVSLWSNEFDVLEGGFLEMLFNGQEKKTSEMAFSFKILLGEEDDAYLRETLGELMDLDSDVPKDFLVYSVSYKYNQKAKKVDLRSISFQYGACKIYHYVTTHTGTFKADTDFGNNTVGNARISLPACFDICNAVILEDKDIGVPLGNGEPSNHVRVIQFLRWISAAINNSMILYFDSLEYFYPSRTLPKRMMKLSIEDAEKVGAFGENTYNVLYAIEVNKETEKKEAINRQLKIFGYAYEWRKHKNGYGEFMLVDLETKSRINILDCGYGISQILPIIVSCFGDGEATLAIDSPDAHLHGSVHGEICDLLINTSKTRNIVVETHSENMLLRLQRRIAEKNDICPDMATIYFIMDSEEGTVSHKISFDEYGDLVNEPEEFKRFFSSSFEDVMLIARAKGERMMEKNAGSN
ncbi:MAG: hypothetical protein Q4A32_04400 [Lachnospiraceae bacterium]|nr:hypothetical protein [Lachnospiraceae bacterium]